jgi:hypothetical protein
MRFTDLLQEFFGGVVTAISTHNAAIFCGIPQINAYVNNPQILEELKRNAEQIVANTDPETSRKFA